MGCDHVRVLGDRYTEENRDAVVGYVTDGLKALGAYAGEKEITVSIEMHGSFTDPDSAMEVIEGVNLPNVGFVFNSQFIGCDAGSIDPLFSRVGPHITAVHTHRVEEPETFDLYRQMFRWLDGTVSQATSPMNVLIRVPTRRRCLPSTLGFSRRLFKDGHTTISTSL